MTGLNTYYPDQWGLNNTGQYGGTNGIDIYAQEAWGITEGCDDIVVAVLDQGVDLDHPDLAGNLLTGYDATDGSDGAINGDCSGDYTHGTCCAGIIAAIDNSIGTKGVAPDCRVIPVRISQNNYINYDDDATEGMNYAWETVGADIISCSWGGGSSSESLNDEISYALGLGRNNLGCVVVFASGNDNSSVHYPANSNSDIIAVGAMSPCGERKSPSSCDGENWGSNYGSTLDVVAPGVFIPTTDLQGSSGYNTSSGTTGDYYLTFNGTSAATPHVAGVAALILSINPDLTQDEVRDIIESTCTKVGSYSYTTTSGRNNGTWNNQTGYGCVNAYEALKAVCQISGPTLFCSSGSFTLNDLPPVDSIIWIPGPYLSISSGQNTSSCTFTKSPVNSGSSWVSARLVTDCGSITLPRKEVYVGGGTVEYIMGPLQASTITANRYLLMTSGLSEPTSFDWFVTPSNSSVIYSYGSSADIEFNNPGDYLLTVSASNTCGSGSPYQQIITAYDSLLLRMSPNPTTGETIITIKPASEKELLVSAWDLEVYTPTQALKEKKTRLKGSSTVINTAGWQEGVYVVRVLYNNEVITGKLIVKR